MWVAVRTKRIQPQEKETEISVPRYLGRNTFGEHETLASGELRECINWDIYPGKERDELRSRRGSDFIKPSVGASVWPAAIQRTSIVWDIGADEYVISQAGNALYFQNLTTPGNPTRIKDFADATFTAFGAGTVAADMFVHGDRLFCIHPSGNIVVEWFSGSSLFKARSIGMTYPTINGFLVGSGAITGRYIYAVELVYQVNGVDVLVSSPNRKRAADGLLADTGDVENYNFDIQIVDMSSTLWTHVRLWRTKNLNPDNSDPLKPIDAQGLPDELYEVALVTRAEISGGALAAVATGGSLPEGNANVLAGKPAGVYTIRDNNTDVVLDNLIGIERIELIPLPASAAGCFHADRVWVTSATNDDIYYSNQEGTKYSELYNPLNIVQTGRDGTLVKRLISFERDLLILKESKTGRLLGGDVDQAFEVLDHRIGVGYRQNAEYIPGIGICAITSDSRDFKIFGLNLVWTTTLNGMDISQPIHEDLADLSADGDMRFLYINGKILVSAGNGSFFVLHVQAGRGWTKYTLPLVVSNGTVNVYTFGGGRRIATSTAATYTVEFELDSKTTDASQLTDDSTSIPLSHVTQMYQGENGRNILDFQWYSLEGELSTSITGTPYANDDEWPAGVAVPVAFSGSGSERRLYLQPQTVGDFLWQRFVGKFLHLSIATTAPAVIRHEKMRVVLDQDDSTFLAEG